MFGPDVLSQYGLVYIDIAPPPEPNLKGDLWFNPDNGFLYIYTDPDWVNTQGGEGTAGAVNKILPGAGISVTPEDGMGAVTVSSTSTIPFFSTSGEEKPITLNP